VGHASVAVDGAGLNKKIYGTIESWRNPADRRRASLCVLDDIVLKRSWAGEVRNVSLLHRRRLGLHRKARTIIFVPE
jgi:hypothetical protein